MYRIEVGIASTARGPVGFAVDIEEAKAFRDMEHRLAVLLRKQCGSKNGGPPTAAEIAEEAVLRVAISNRAQALKCPPKYGPGDARNDSDRLHRLFCRRISPGRALTSAEDEEEAFLTARLAAYRHSPEGRGRRRMRELEFKGIGGCLDLDEQKELDQIALLYPEPPRESELATAITLKLAELRKSGRR